MIEGWAENRRKNIHAINKGNASQVNRRAGDPNVKPMNTWRMATS